MNGFGAPVEGMQNVNLHSWVGVHEWKELSIVRMVVVRYFFGCRSWPSEAQRKLINLIRVRHAIP